MPDDREVGTLYEKGITVQDIIDNPILKPVMEINETYKVLDKSVRYSIDESDKLLTEMETFMKGNPIWGKTRFINSFLMWKDHVKTIIRIDEEQKKMEKKCINEMIKIASQYQVNSEQAPQEEPSSEEPFQTEEPLPDMSYMNEEQTTEDNLIPIEKEANGIEGETN